MGFLVKLIAWYYHILEVYDLERYYSLLIVVSSKEFEHNSFQLLCIQPL